jgi:glycosyltransferase involved in cell wall biosynthesis
MSVAANSNATPTRVVAVIPALNEAGNLAALVREVHREVDAVVVVDNGSTDDTAAVAHRAGADVVTEPERGYGAACLAGIQRAEGLGADIILFLDGDGSDDPSFIPALLRPVLDGADVALGVRVSALREPHAMTSVQRFGNWLAPMLLRRWGGVPCRDLPPFKAIRVASLRALALRERQHGFTSELVLKAFRARMRVVDVPVPCRARKAGASKVSGTVWGATRAAARIMTMVARQVVSVRREGVRA